MADDKDLDALVAQGSAIVDLARGLGVSTDPDAPNDPKKLIAAGTTGMGVGLGAFAQAGPLIGAITAACPPCGAGALVYGGALCALVGLVAGVLSAIDFDTKSFDYGDPEQAKRNQALGNDLVLKISSVVAGVPEPARSELARTLSEVFTKAGPPIQCDKNNHCALLGFPIVLQADQAPSGRYVNAVSFASLVAAGATLTDRIHAIQVRANGARWASIMAANKALSLAHGKASADRWPVNAYSAALKEIMESGGTKDGSAAAAPFLTTHTAGQATAQAAARRKTGWIIAGASVALGLFSVGVYGATRPRAA